MYKFCVIVYSAVTRGHRLGHALVTQYPESFAAKKIYKHPPQINGHDVYHGVIPFFHAELHLAERFNAQNLEALVKQSVDFSLLDKNKYNLILISGDLRVWTLYPDVIKTIFKDHELKVITIVVESENEDYVYRRYLDIINDLTPTDSAKVTDNPETRYYIHSQFIAVKNITDTISFPFEKLKYDSVPVDLSSLGNWVN
jgi:hypothetical protein